MSNLMKTIILVVIVIIVGLFTLNFIKDSDTKEAGPIKIGVSTILSEPWAVLGENIVQTATLAVKEINEDGGVKGRQIELVVQDAGLDSKTGLSAAQKLINVDGVKYIIGGTSSNGTLAAAPLVNEKKVIYLTPVTGGSNVDSAGEYVFRIANADVLAGRDIADAMIGLGFNKVASIAEVTEYTIDIANSFEKRIKERGGEIIFTERFHPETSDFRTIITKMKEVKPEALLIVSQTGISGGLFVKQAREQEFEVPMFSDFTFVANEDAKKIVGSFEGIYFADPAYDLESSKLKNLFTLYEKEYGSSPIIPFHSAATYDSIQLLVEAIESVGDDSEKVHDWLLKNVKEWEGLTGTFSLDREGNSDLGFVMKVISGGEAILLDI